MADICKRRAVIEFRFLFGRIAVDTVDMLSAAYREHALKKKSKFLNGIRVLNAETCRPKTFNARTDVTRS